MHWRVSTVALMFVSAVAGGFRFFPMDTAFRNLNELDTIKALGYDGVSWIVGKPADVESAVQQIRQRGLKLFAVYDYHSALLTDSSLILDPDLDGTMEALKGTNAIVWLPISSEVFRASSPDGDTIAVPALRRLADRMAARGLRVAIYPHMNCWVERVQDAVRLAKKVDRPNLGVTFNLCHCLMVGDEAKIPALLTEAMPYLFAVTINGADGGASFSSWDQLIRPLDEGTYDVRCVTEKLEALHYAGPVGLQGFGVKIPVEDNLVRSMSAWRHLTEKRQHETD